MPPVTLPRRTVPSLLVRHGWQPWRRVLGVVTSLAVVLTLAAVTPQVAAADTAGTPPNIIDYTRVVPADWGALQRFEAQAARDVLTNHSLPDDDYDAVRGWARNQVRTQMWANLVVIIKKTEATRTTDEQAVYRWFQTLVQERNVAAARATVDQFIRYSGLTESTYTTSEPVNYNNPDKNLATGGYCTYRAPGPYLDDYDGWLDQTCYTAGTGLANFAIPMPSYDEFIAYGQYLANKDEVANANFANTSFEVAASLAMGASVALAVTASVLPITLALGAGATLGATAAAAASVVFPFAARVGSLALVATGALAAVVGTVIIFVVSVVLASIQVEAQLNMGRKLKKNLDDLTATAPDLREQILDDEERAADDSLSDDEQKPKYYGGFFTTFLQGTLPEADAEPCSGGLVIGGGIYAPGCVNSPTPAPVVVDDPVFSVIAAGEFAGTQRRSVTVLDPYNGGAAVTRASGKGWFVHKDAESGRVSQSLVMPYRNWDGESYFAERIWDATNGYRFSITPVGDGAEATDAVVTDKLQVTLSDNSTVTLRLVPSPVSSVGVTLPDPVVLGQPATFTATASGSGAPGVAYSWWFPRLFTEPIFGTRPAGVPDGYWSVDGATAVRTFDTAGPLPVFLEVRSPDGTQQVTRYEITVVDGRSLDRLTIVPPEGLRAGTSTVLNATAASGAFVRFQPLDDGEVCRGILFQSLPTLDVVALKAGTCRLRVYTGEFSPTVQPVELTVSFPVFKGEQAITAPVLGDLVAGETQTVTATASSTLPVAIAVAPIATEVCAVTGTTVSASSAGSCKLLLTQAGDNNFLPAPPVLVEFSVEAPVTVTARDETIVYGGAPAYEFDVSDPAAEVTGVECAADPPLTVGTHPITCSGGSLTGDGTIAYAAGTLTVTPAPVTVTVTPSAVQYSDAVPNLNASSSASGLLGSDTLSGSLSGCTAPGLTLVSGKVTSPAGSYPLAGCGGLSNPNYTVGYTGSLTVQKESAALTFDGDWYFSTGTATSAPVTVKATLTQAADGALGDITKARVDFLLFKADNLGSTPDYSALGVAVDSSGHASAAIPAVPEGLYRVVTRVPSGNAYFSATSTSDELAVYSPVPGTGVGGGGWVADAGSRDGKGHFGISVHYDKKKQPQGKVSFSWRNPTNGYDYLVRSTTWTGGSLAVRPGLASISVKSTLTVVDPATGLVVTALSGGNHSMKVDVVDGGSGGKSDTYAITVKTPSGAVLHSLGARSLGGGNVTVQP